MQKIEHMRRAVTLLAGHLRHYPSDLALDCLMLLNAAVHELAARRDEINYLAEVCQKLQRQYEQDKETLDMAYARIQCLADQVEQLKHPELKICPYCKSRYKHHDIHFCSPIAIKTN